MPKFIDLTGQRFSELTVEGLASYKMNNRPAWVCLCDCGQRKTVMGQSLKSGDVKCCGQHKTKFYSESVSARSKVQNRKYPIGSDSHSRVYTLWRAMLWRCNDPKHEAYGRYGGAGITVCQEWQEFEGFRRWAVAYGYDEKLTIDRVDNTKGYSPENCRWATRKEQARNRKSSNFITAFGETKYIMDWAKDQRCIVTHRTLYKRIKYGHDPELALTASEHDLRCKAQDYKRSPLPRHLR